MLKRLYAAFDEKALFFHPPFLANTGAEAIRNFLHGAREAPARDDLVIYYLGDFDDSIGEIKARTPIERVGGYDELLERSDDDAS